MSEGQAAGPLANRKRASWPDALKIFIHDWAKKKIGESRGLSIRAVSRLAEEMFRIPKATGRKWMAEKNQDTIAMWRKDKEAIPRRMLIDLFMSLIEREKELLKNLNNFMTDDC